MAINGIRFGTNEYYGIINNCIEVYFINTNVSSIETAPNLYIKLFSNKI